MESVLNLERYCVNLETKAIEQLPSPIPEAPKANLLNSVQQVTGQY